MKFSSVADILSDIANGKPVIVIDSEDRENEGDLVIASELATPEAINFMAKEGRGLICVSLTEERAEQLDLEVIENKNSASIKQTLLSAWMQKKIPQLAFLRLIDL